MKKLDLQWQILIGIVAGIVLGMGVNLALGAGVSGGFIGGVKTVFQYGGDIFVRLLRMVIVPLVFASIYMAVANLGDIRKLGKIGGKTIGYYFLTTALAVLAGLFVVNLINPGLGIDQAALDALNISRGIPDKVSAQGVGERSAALIIVDTFVNMIPKNPIAALSKGDVLQIIFFALFLGVMSTMMKEKSAPLTRVMDALDHLMQASVMVIMKIAPWAIFMLVAAIFMDLGLGALKALGKYAATVLLGLGIHAVITLPLLVVTLGRYNPLTLFRALAPALMTAWSTASSAATLPVTMLNVKRRAGVHEEIADFVLPLGATINMDGTALYESVAVIFIAQLMGIDLSMGQQVVIFITASLAAVGAAAIPGAGLVTMGIVLTAVGLPLEGIGLILAIDRILDQFRTAINVWGDGTAAVVVGRLEGAIDDSVSPERPAALD